jgi:hypothetical protein
MAGASVFHLFAGADDNDETHNENKQQRILNEGHVEWLPLQFPYQNTLAQCYRTNSLKRQNLSTRLGGRIAGLS